MAGLLAGSGMVEPGPAAAGQAAGAASGNGHGPALGGVQPGHPHRREKRESGVGARAGMDGLAAFGAAVLQEPLVHEAGEDDGQVPVFEPGTAE